MTTAKNGNWIEEWREALKNTTLDEIEAIADRLQAEHPEEYSTPEEVLAMVGRTEEPEATTRRVELVGA